MGGLGAWWLSPGMCRRDNASNDDVMQKTYAKGIYVSLKMDICAVAKMKLQQGPWLRQKRPCKGLAYFVSNTFEH